MPLVDLGPGRLHGNREPPSNQPKGAGGKGKGHQSKNGRQSKDNDVDSRLHRRGSAGNIEDRVRQGQNAVWGGRGAPDDGISGGGDDDDGNWWDTGTPYAFQPRLSADKTTVLSFFGAAAGRRDRGAVGLDQRGVLRGKGGGSDDDSRAESRTDSVASGLSVQLQQQQQLQRGHETSRQLMRIVKVPEGNEHHGQRVFFLA